MSHSKMSARERIENLFDDSTFVEIGSLVSARNTDYNLGAKKLPGDGLITGYGVIGDRMVYVYSQDGAVLGGSVGEMHAKKIAAVYDLAIKTGAPVIGMIDSSGLRLQESTMLFRLSELFLQSRPRLPAGFRRSARSSDSAAAAVPLSAPFLILHLWKGRMALCLSTAPIH